MAQQKKNQTTLFCRHIYSVGRRPGSQDMRNQSGTALQSDGNRANNKNNAVCDFDCDQFGHVGHLVSQCRLLNICLTSNMIRLVFAQMDRLFLENI